MENKRCTVFEDELTDSDGYTHTLITEYLGEKPTEYETTFYRKSPQVDGTIVIQRCFRYVSENRQDATNLHDILDMLLTNTCMYGHTFVQVLEDLIAGHRARGSHNVHYVK